MDWPAALPWGLAEKATRYRFILRLFSACWYFFA
jgi:hypothetical protein